MINNSGLLEKVYNNRIKSELSHNKMIFHYKIIQTEIKTYYQMKKNIYIVLKHNKNTHVLTCKRNKVNLQVSNLSNIDL